MATDFEHLARILAGHVDDLQRLSYSWSEDAAAVYDASEAAVLAEIDSVITRFAEGKLTAANIRLLKSLKKRIAEIRAACYNEIIDKLEDDTVELMKNEEKFNIAWIVAMFAVMNKPKPSVKQLSQEVQESIQSYGIYSGSTVNDIFAKVHASDIERITIAITRGIGSHATLEQIRKNVIKAMAITDRQIRLNMGIVVNGISNDVSVAVSIKNKSIIHGVMWVTALDDRVCEDCEPLEGTVYFDNNAPACPVHANCRCHLVPVTKEIIEEGKGI